MKLIVSFKRSRPLFWLAMCTALVLGMLSPGLAGEVYAQANADTIIQVNANQNNILITEVEYLVMRPVADGGPYTWIQTESGQNPPANHSDGDPLPADVPVNIVRVTGTGDIEFLPTPEIPTASNFHPKVASDDYPPAEWAPAEQINVFTPTDGFSHRIGDDPNPDYFTEINNVISIPDMRSYWDLGGNALGIATEENPQSFMDVLYARPILPGDVVLISERFGNTPMSFTPLDIDGNVITGGATVSVGGAPSNEGGVLYQWNTRINNVPDPSGNQRQWLIMVSASLFYNNRTDLPDVYGWRVNMTTTDGGDGKILLLRKSIGLWKKATLINGEELVPFRFSAVGDEITYTFTVTNDGNVTLTGVTVTDPLPGLSVITFQGSTGVSPEGTLAAGESATYTATYLITQDDLDRGEVYNEATATGTDPDQNEITATDDEMVRGDQDPSIALEKKATLINGIVPTPFQYSALGDVITYAFTVSNNGTVTLTDVNVVDTIGGVIMSGGPIASLAPGASDSTTFTATYTVTQEDIDAGSFYNLATATGTDPNDEPVTATDDETVTADQDPSIDLEKKATLINGIVPTPFQYSAVGDEITYTFTVRNIGNVTLTDVKIDDARLGISDLAVDPSTLAPDAIGTATATYTVTQDDIDEGSIFNTATATGTFDDEDYTNTDDDTVDGPEAKELPPVGGTGYPVNPLMLLLPWLGLATILAGTALLVLKRGRTQN